MDLTRIEFGDKMECTADKRCGEGSSVIGYEVSGAELCILSEPLVETILVVAAPTLEMSLTGSQWRFVRSLYPAVSALSAGR